MMNRSGPTTQSFLSKMLRYLRVSASVSLMALAFGLSACSIPNLEPADCTAARNVMREFYSFHFGNDMKFSIENLELRKRFLTAGFFDELRGREQQALDPFTLTNDVPKAFRVGECRVTESGKRTEFEVLLFWKDDQRSEQRTIHAEAVNDNGSWLLDGVRQ
jgi:hypothetical protein